MPRKPIYVEIMIQTDIESLWKYSQDPVLHESWDLRFSEIQYLPKSKESDLQQFKYATKIGFGMRIEGLGETYSTYEKDDVRTSVLKFSSDQSLSLIREGAGFWKYIPTDGGVRFITRYDYQTRFGKVGEWFDQLIFRPMMGWATAWSFDRLRLSLEKEISPRVSFSRSLTDLLCISILSVDWIYQGLVPKLLVQNSGEMDILQSTGLFHGYESIVLAVMGICEISFGLFLLLLGRKWRKIMYLLNLILMVLLGISAIGQPHVYVEPFNPISLNVSMIALSLVGLLQLHDLPDASRCKRTVHGKDE
ncbi:DoxX-like family protein [Paenibacillus sp. N3.4]|uniref:DoxX-like family protein n=1 Tax=Paenibacillus sp. N3.4 TaxID=2603222 RepID=UPI0011C74DE3|nr:DoxX-like family protein [Paenibacillus sp. N3.4]TXK83542.1 hypothetical protein FU659_13270 [Paenibacillus sp. N3.4]